MNGTNEEVRQRQAADGLGREGWLGQGPPGRARTPALAWGLGAPGMEVLTLAPWVGVPPIKQRGRLQPREVRERGTLRLGRSGRQALPLPPVTEAAPPVTMPEGWTITWSRRQDLS